MSLRYWTGTAFLSQKKRYTKKRSNLFVFGQRSLIRNEAQTAVRSLRLNMHRTKTEIFLTKAFYICIVYVCVQCIKLSPILLPYFWVNVNLINSLLGKKIPVLVLRLFSLMLVTAVCVLFLIKNNQSVKMLWHRSWSCVLLIIGS